ncbi:MAG: ribonuclease III family protein [Candidatus Bathyarchaeia archaeon]
MSKLRRRFALTPEYKTLREILTDHELATLGDAYVNLLYSLYLSAKTKKPTGEKADSRTLADALKRSGLREQVASRADRHKQADAAEALLVYAWLQETITITECIEIMLKHESPVEAFGALLSHANKRLDL